MYRLREIKAVYKDFGEFMMSKIISTKASLESDVDGKRRRKDVLTRLFDSSEGGGLTDQEIVGNVFGFLLAGYGASCSRTFRRVATCSSIFASVHTATTAQTMAVTLGLLAAHPEAQEDVYQEVMKVPENGKEDPVSLLQYILRTPF